MGKFGGQELNYSSDIDVIFFYGEDGQLNPHFSHKEFFTRLSERIIATFSANDAAGAALSDRPATAARWRLRAARPLASTASNITTRPSARRGSAWR